MKLPKIEMSEKTMKVAKYALTGGSLGLTFFAGLIESKLQEKAIGKKVIETIASLSKNNNK